MAAPRNVLLAIQLMVLNLLLLILINVLIFTTHEVTLIEPKTIFKYSNLGLLLETCIHGVLIVFIIWGILRAYSWPRWLYIAYVVALIFLHITTHSANFSSYAVFYLAVVYLIVEAISFVLLFSPTANQFFKHQKK